MVDGRSKKRQAGKSEFKIVWPGVKRCQDCGFSVAYLDIRESDTEEKKTEKKEENRKENSAHSTYHGKYMKAQDRYGAHNVVLYSDLCKLEAVIFDKLKTLKSNDTISDVRKMSSCYHDAKLFAMALKRWSRNLERSPSHNVQSDLEFLQGCMNKITKIRHENKGKSDFELIDDLSKLVHVYEEVSEKLSEIEESIHSGNKEYSDIPYPTFNIDLKEKIDILYLYIQTIPTKNSRVLATLQDFFRIEFTKSLRLWDMCKEHPIFEDYCILLWNTPKFIEYMQQYMTENQIQFYVEQNKANRELVDSKFDDVPFYFGSVKDNGVELTDGVKDLSYMDRIYAEDDEDLELEDAEEVDEKTMQNIEAAFQIITKKANFGRKGKVKKGGSNNEAAVF